MPARRPTAAALLSLAVMCTAVAGCAEKASSDPSNDAIKVDASDSACDVSALRFPAGSVNLAIHNTGSKVTEVYVYAPGDRVVTERENIGPGTKATVTAELKAGTYEIACKPGMQGDGIRQRVTVTGADGVASADPRLGAAVTAYRGYVQQQADTTVPVVQQFADAVKAGDLERAKSLFAPSRIGWERTEPVAESFGDIDPRTDVREDGLEDGQKWTGWHRLEKALWHDKKIGAEEKAVADQLVSDIKEWQRRIGTAEITPTSMANGAKELLDEVATGKVTGEEDRYSHTDLSDFNANVEGALSAYVMLKTVVVERDPKLVVTLETEFADLLHLLSKYRQSEDFVTYDKVTPAERRALSDAVNALAEPLSRLAAAVAP